MYVAKKCPALVALLALAACGGGGDGGGGNGGGPSALSLTTSTPANGATSVARNGSIVLTFSTTLDQTTIGQNTVSLTTAAGNQTVVTSVAGNTLTVSPFNKLAPRVSSQWVRRRPRARASSLTAKAMQSPYGNAATA
jgi:Big-like domain-containing protein